MPLLTFLYCLFVKGLILNGRAGIFYALQRLIAEAALSLMVLEERFRAKSGQQPSKSARDSREFDADTAPQLRNNLLDYSWS